MNPKIFSLEYDPQQEKLELHLNDQGIEELIEVLTKLKESGIKDHAHLMTPDWGGNHLTTDAQNLDPAVGLIHHLKLCYWGK